MDAKSQTSQSLELSRLLAAAVVNPGFCRLLLNQPRLALANGYNGSRFRLPAEERQRILSIRASSLADLATQLITPSHNGGNGVNGNGMHHHHHAAVLPGKVLSP